MQSTRTQRQVKRDKLFEQHRIELDKNCLPNGGPLR
jgi:hypothetical protein